MVRQSRLFSAAGPVFCAAFLLTLLGNSQSFAITVTAQGGGSDCAGFLNTGSASVSGSAVCGSTDSVFASTGSVGASASAGHVGASTIVATTGPAAGINLQGTGIYSDVFTFHSSNPSLTTTTVSLNLDAFGTMGVGGPFAFAEVLLRTNIGFASVGELRSSIDTTGHANCTSTLVGGCTGGVFAPGHLATQSIQVFLNSPVVVELRIDTTVSASAPGSSASSEFSNSLDFPIGLALFNLDPGITVDAPSSFVTDNIFAPPGAATPLPAALPLFASGLGALGLLGWRRKKKAAVVH